MSIIKTIFLICFLSISGLFSQIVYKVRCSPRIEVIKQDKKILKDTVLSILVLDNVDTFILKGNVIITDMLINSGLIIISENSRLIVHNRENRAQIINYSNGTILNKGILSSDIILCNDAKIISENGLITTQNMLMERLSSLTMYSSHLYTTLIVISGSIICLSNKSVVSAESLFSMNNILTAVSLDESESIIRIKGKIDILDGHFCINKNLKLEICENIIIDDKINDQLTVINKKCD
ncbi:MAG: hypothetical protein QXF12_00240 [Candidatus Aenigmatarchaeota archaeon]